MAGKVHINEVQEVRVGYSTGVFTSLAQRIVKDLRPELLSEGDLTISLVWVDDQKIQIFNKKYRGKNKATDVLSFSYLDQLQLSDKEKELGELVISNETLLRQAEEMGHSNDLEAKILFTHGLLHLLGFDHEQEADMAIMLDLELKYLGDKAGLIARSKAE